MGPNRAAKIFAERCPEVDSYRVTLYGSLAATGEGHMTDVAIKTVLEPIAKLELIWEPETFLPFHPNGMLFEGIKEGKELKRGDKLGMIGESAISELADESHLHIEMTVGGISVDPADYFSQEAKDTISGVNGGDQEVAADK